MLRNYFKTAWRNLLKQKGFSLINILGLAIGLAAFGLIALYVTDELSYDKHNRKADRVFRVVQHGAWQGGEINLAVTSAPYAFALKNDYHEVEDVTRINAEGGAKVSYGDKSFIANDMLLSDNSIFNIFTFDFLDGDAKSALVLPNSIVLTKGMAIKLFGGVSKALNKTILLDGNLPNRVTGVIEDVPVNSHFTFSALRSFDTNYTTGWGNADLYTYVLLKNGADPKKIEANSEAFHKKYLSDVLSNVKFKMELQPLRSIHLHSKLDYELGSNGNITYVYVFSIVGLLILVLAIINYVNLTTARSAARVKEIGVRKVVGSGRTSLMMMFFSESVLLALFAIGVAVVLVNMALPYFNQIANKTLSFSQFGIVNIFVGCVLFSITTGILSGFYPALFLSGFRTIPAMKGQMGDQSSTVLFRKSLVTFQFVTTIAMIAGSLVIYQQLQYVLNKDLGFNKAQTLTFHIQNQSARSQIGAIKDQLLTNPAIEGVAVAGNPIGNNDLGGNGFNPNPEQESGPNRKVVQNLVVNADFIPTMQIQISQGRNFSESMPTDKQDAIIINETLVKELGWKNALGRKVMTNDRLKTIIGVAKDFNTYSLQHKIAPVVLSMPQRDIDQDNLYVRIGKGNTQATLAYISKVYAEFDAENKPDFNFLDQNFARQYQSEEKQGRLLMIFTVLAITIASLGLLGLVAFAAQQRTREIGVRKVLGATVGGIALLLSKDLLKLVLLAIIIATPIGIWAMNSWLQQFAYRVNIQWWTFALAGFLAILIAIVTVSFQAIKAALANPVKSLQTE